MSVKTGYPPIPSDINLSLGPIFYGHLFNWTLLGVLVVQTYVFTLNFPNEKAGIRRIVYFLFFLELLQTALQSYSVTHWFVIGWGDARVANSILLHGFDSPVIDSVIGAIVQCFYCWRLWVLGKSYLLCGLIFITSMMQLVGGIMCGVGASMVAKTFSEMGISKYQHTTASIWFSSSAAGDILIAISMTYLLLRNKPSNWRTSNFLIKFTRLTVETNTLTAGIAITAAISFSYSATLTVPVYLTCSMTMGKLYTNTLLVMLNSRIYVNTRGGPGGSAPVAYISGGSGGRSGDSGGSDGTKVFETKSVRYPTVQSMEFTKEEVVEFDLQPRSPGGTVQFNV